MKELVWHESTNISVAYADHGLYLVKRAAPGNPTLVSFTPMKDDMFDFDSTTDWTSENREYGKMSCAVHHLENST